MTNKKHRINLVRTTNLQNIIRQSLCKVLPRLIKDLRFNHQEVKKFNNHNNLFGNKWFYNQSNNQLKNFEYSDK